MILAMPDATEAYGRHINYTGRSEFDPEQKREKPYIVKVIEEAPAQA